MIPRLSALFLVANCALQVAAGEYREIIESPSSGAYEEDLSGPCAAVFSGPITANDIETLPETGSPGPITLCLDSPGGNLGAALDLPTDRGWAARVLPGDRCESACALAFLRAGYEIGNGIPGFLHDRAIWAGAKLGLHSPGLSLPDTVRVDRRSVESAFKVALSAMADVYQVHQSQDSEGAQTMNAYLYQRFADTPPDEMYYIDTVGRALLANVTVLGVARKARMDADQVRTLCENAMLTSEGWETSLQVQYRIPNRSAEELMRSYKSSFTEFHNEWMEGDNAGLKVHLVQQDNGDTIGYAGLYPSGDYRYFTECFTLFPASRQSSDNLAWDEGFSVWLGTGYEPALDTAQVLERWANTKDNNPIAMDSLALFPFDARLEELPKTALYNRYFSGSFEPGNLKKLGFDRHAGHDVTGRDLAALKLDDEGDCLLACQSDSACSAATFDRWNKRCFLKAIEGPSEMTVIAKATSFVRLDVAKQISETTRPLMVKRRVGKRFFTRPDQRLRDRTYATCAEYCQEIGWCRAFNHFEEKMLCELFVFPPEYFSETGSAVGFLETRP